jgi:hypothetical protein
MTKNELWGKIPDGDWEWIDSAEGLDDSDRATLLMNYRQAFPVDWRFKWSNNTDESQENNPNYS